MSEDAVRYRTGTDVPFRVSLTYARFPAERVDEILDLIQARDTRAGAVASTRTDSPQGAVTVTIDDQNAGEALRRARALVEPAIGSWAHLVGIEVEQIDGDE